VLRSRATGLPIISGESIKSGLKGIARPAASEEDLVTATKWAHWRNLFGRGSDEDRGDDGGMIKPQVGRLLALPVESPQHMVVWLTCPWALWQLVDRCAAVGIATPDPPGVPADDEEILLALKATTGADNLIQVREFSLGSRSEVVRDKWATWIGERYFGPPHASSAAFGEQVSKRLVIGPGWLFSHMARVGLERRHRTRMHAGKKIVKTMWIEEHLPEGSLSWGLVGVEPRHKCPEPSHRVSEDDARSWLLGEESGLELRSPHGSTVQIGGISGTGKGFVNLRFHQR